MRLSSPSAGTTMSLSVALSFLSFTSSALANPINTLHCPVNSSTALNSALYTPNTAIKPRDETTSSSILGSSVGKNGWTYITTLITTANAKPTVTPEGTWADAGTESDDSDDSDNEMGTVKARNQMPPNAVFDDTDTEEEGNIKARDFIPDDIVVGDEPPVSNSSESSDSEEPDHELAFDIAPMAGFDLSPSSVSDFDSDGNQITWDSDGHHIVVMRDAMPSHLGDEKDTSSSNSDPHLTMGSEPHWTDGDLLLRGILIDDTPSDEHADFDSADADSFGRQGTGSKSDPIIVTDTSDFESWEDIVYTS